MPIKIRIGNDKCIPRWFLVLVFTVAGLAATAWAGWVTNVCLSVSSLPAQIQDMAADIKWLIRHGK